VNLAPEMKALAALLVQVCARELVREVQTTDKTMRPQSERTASDAAREVSHDSCEN